VLGDMAANKLMAIKRVPLVKTSTVKLAFEAPSQQGEAHLKLFFVCDSYMGCDQEYEVDLEVGPPEEGSSGSSSSEEEGG
jgi:pre-mRNA-splicing helicase BRR2